MDDIVVPGDPKQYDLERIRLEHSWLDEVGVEPELRDKAQEVFRAAFAASTWTTYNGYWRQWVKWALARNWPALPASPAAVAFYVVDLGGVNKYATIIQKVIAIAVGHRFAKEPDPTKHFDVKDCLKGVARIWGAAQHGKAALAIENLVELEQRYAQHANQLEACRDLTVLKVGIAIGQRGTQLSELDVEHLSATDHGYRVHIPRSKTDPYYRGDTVWIPPGLRDITCPVLQLQRWFAISGITTGAVFRRVSSQGRLGERLKREGVSEVVKRTMALLGLPPEDFGSHSLRVSFVSLAHEGGASDEAIMDQTGHKKRDSVRRYLRYPDYPETNTSALVGL